MVVSQPLVAHGVGGQDVDDLYRIGVGTVDQSGLVVFHQPQRLVLRSSPNPYLNNFSGRKGT